MKERKRRERYARPNLYSVPENQDLELTRTSHIYLGESIHKSRSLLATGEQKRSSTAAVARDPHAITGLRNQCTAVQKMVLVVRSTADISLRSSKMHAGKQDG